VRRVIIGLHWLYLPFTWLGTLGVLASPAGGSTGHATLVSLKLPAASWAVPTGFVVLYLPARIPTGWPKAAVCAIGSAGALMSLLAAATSTAGHVTPQVTVVRLEFAATHALGALASATVVYLLARRTAR
jgi:mannitol-specific phosphotransferase system IIBC component